MTRVKESNIAVTNIDDLLDGLYRRNMLPVITDSSGWYKAWYFDLRFREEIERSIRYAVPASLVCIQLRASPDGVPVRQILASSRSLLRSTDIGAQLDDDTIVLCLPHTDSEGASMVIERLVRALADRLPMVGRASYPNDGSDAEALLAMAFNRATFGPIGA